MGCFKYEFDLEGFLESDYFKNTFIEEIYPGLQREIDEIDDVFTKTISKTKNILSLLKKEIND